MLCSILEQSVMSQFSKNPPWARDASACKYYSAKIHNAHHMHTYIMSSSYTVDWIGL